MANNRGHLWKDDEVRELIFIWGDAEVMRMFDSKHKNGRAYNKIAERLNAKGINRSADQCQTKLKAVRQQYIKVRDMIRRSGESAAIKAKCKNFDELDAFLGTRPATEPDGVIDSLTDENEGDTEINESRSDSDDEAGGVIEEEEASQHNDRVRNNNRIVVPGTRKRKRDSTDDLIAKDTREWQRDRDEYYNRQDQRDRLREEEERKRRDAEDGQMNQMMTLMNNTMMAIADSLRSLNTQNASYHIILEDKCTE